MQDVRQLMNDHVRAKLFRDAKQRRIQRDSSSRRAAAEASQHVTQSDLRDAGAERACIDFVYQCLHARLFGNAYEAPEELAKIHIGTLRSAPDGPSLFRLFGGGSHPHFHGERVDGAIPECDRKCSFCTQEMTKGVDHLCFSMVGEVACHALEEGRNVPFLLPQAQASCQSDQYAVTLKRRAGGSIVRSLDAVGESYVAHSLARRSAYPLGFRTCEAEREDGQRFRRRRGCAETARKTQCPLFGDELLELEAGGDFCRSAGDEGNPRVRGCS